MLTLTNTLQGSGRPSWNVGRCLSTDKGRPVQLVIIVNNLYTSQQGWACSNDTSLYVLTHLSIHVYAVHIPPGSRAGSALASYDRLCERECLTPCASATMSGPRADKRTSQTTREDTLSGCVRSHATRHPLQSLGCTITLRLDVYCAKGETKIDKWLQSSRAWVRLGAVLTQITSTVAAAVCSLSRGGSSGFLLYSSAATHDIYGTQVV